MCGAEARGFAHKPPRGQTQLPVQHACSMACLDTIYEVAKRDGDMVDPTTEEENALLHGGAMGGDYLESLGKPGVLEAFAHLSRDEWRTFVECIVTGFQDNLRESVTQKYDRNAKQ